LPVDSFPPTDGSGDFQVPLAPNLTQSDFAGATLDGIRALYRGSGGWASYDISWAQDAAGRSVFLPEINFISVDVLSGRAEIDVGLLNCHNTTYVMGFRVTSVCSMDGVRNILEFDYFPAAGFGDTTVSTIISSNNVFAYYNNFLTLRVGDRFRITISYTATN